MALLFCMFPYTQIIPLESYNQPYAAVFSAAALLAMWPVISARFPFPDAVALGALAVLGLFAFAATCFPSPKPQEVKYLLIYLSPILFAMAGFATIHSFPALADKVITLSAFIWVLVGIVQATVAPDFATQLVGEFGDAADDLIDSGRGVLGLAPEPTHFGFHMIIMAALLVLVGGRNVMALVCIATAVLIARSSSALLALILGALIYFLIFGGRARLALVLIIPLYYLVGLLVDGGMLPAEWRITRLMTEFWYDPFYLLTSDASANARLGGIYVGAKEIVSNYFFPAGLSHETWFARVGPIMSENGWLIFISLTGIPSGILIAIYQLGIFGLLILGFMLWRMMTRLRSHIETLLVCSVVFVFFSQYMISTPGFGLIYGAVLARKVAAGERLGWGRRMRGRRKLAENYPQAGMQAG
ncbi:hypothetical protein [Tsuneonella dongtanensis]|uniref:hypothetical protein n=1 Tax=Tsuneonella dongtanensis TaxID=692370 RepID=UPI0012ECF1D5|nr:hypothetical protein [Tsuneonella dongtanensis]